MWTDKSKSSYIFFNFIFTRVWAPTHYNMCADQRTTSWSQFSFSNKQMNLLFSPWWKDKGLLDGLSPCPGPELARSGLRLGLGSWRIKVSVCRHLLFPLEETGVNSPKSAACLIHGALETAWDGSLCNYSLLGFLQAPSHCVDAFCWLPHFLLQTHILYTHTHIHNLFVSMCIGVLPACVSVWGC